MAYEIVQNGGTQFAIDWDIVHRLLRSYWTAYLQYQYGQEVTMSDSHWYNPMSWSLPDVSHIEVDWGRVRHEAVWNTDQEVQSMRQQAKYNARGIAWDVAVRIDEAARYKLFVDWMGEVQTQNMSRINKAVEDYESKVESRDLSATRRPMVSWSAHPS